MTIAEAQHDVRSIYLGGFAGQLVSGSLWLASSVLWMLRSPRYGIVTLVIGGMFIFPFTQLLLRAMGRPASLSPGNPFRELAFEVALLVPLALPLVGAAAIHRIEWFYPALAVVVGAHYLPFAFVYGVRLFIVLSAILVAAGTGVGLYIPEAGNLLGWFTGVLLILFALLGKHAARMPAASA
jgi:hypothetical protein